MSYIVKKPGSLGAISKPRPGKPLLRPTPAKPKPLVAPPVLKPMIAPKPLIAPAPVLKPIAPVLKPIAPAPVLVKPATSPVLTRPVLAPTSVPVLAPVKPVALTPILTKPAVVAPIVGVTTATRPILPRPAGNTIGLQPGVFPGAAGPCGPGFWRDTLGKCRSNNELMTPPTLRPPIVPIMPVLLEKGIRPLQRPTPIFTPPTISMPPNILPPEPLSIKNPLPQVTSAGAEATQPAVAVSTPAGTQLAPATPAVMKEISADAESPELVSEATRAPEEPKKPEMSKTTLALLALGALGVGYMLTRKGK